MKKLVHEIGGTDPNRKVGNYAVSTIPHVCIIYLPIMNSVQQFIISGPCIIKNTPHLTRLEVIPYWLVNLKGVKKFSVF